MSGGGYGLLTDIVVGLIGSLIGGDPHRDRARTQPRASLNSLAKEVYHDRCANLLVTRLDRQRRRRYCWSEIVGVLLAVVLIIGLVWYFGYPRTVTTTTTAPAPNGPTINVNNPPSQPAAGSSGSTTNPSTTGSSPSSAPTSSSGSNAPAGSTTGGSPPATPATK